MTLSGKSRLSVVPWQAGIFNGLVTVGIRMIRNLQRQSYDF
jgi:hypothetical protein